MSDAIVTKPKILIIDDEKDIVKGLKDTLLNEHLDVLAAYTGKQGLKLAQENKPDLILLDLRLPDMDGYDVCRLLKQDSDTSEIPVLMVSTRSKDSEKIVGLEIGADDYITKPYNDLELLARIRVALRRKIKSTGAAPKSLQRIHGSVRLDGEGRKVLVDGVVVNLTKKEFDLLDFLMSKPGKALTRSNILSAVWPADFDSLQGTVDSHIKTLRKKLGDASRYIETIPAVGYRWAEEE